MQVAFSLKSNNYKCSKIVRSYYSIEQPDFSYSTNQNITILEEWQNLLKMDIRISHGIEILLYKYSPEAMSQNDSVSTSHNRPNLGSA